MLRVVMLRVVMLRVVMLRVRSTADGEGQNGRWLVDAPVVSAVRVGTTRLAAGCVLQAVSILSDTSDSASRCPKAFNMDVPFRP